MKNLVVSQFCEKKTSDGINANYVHICVVKPIGRMLEMSPGLRIRSNIWVQNNTKINKHSFLCHLLTIMACQALQYCMWKYMCSISKYFWTSKYIYVLKYIYGLKYMLDKKYICGLKIYIYALKI